jgi:hypothetical protein
MMWRWLRISLLVLCAIIAIAAGFEHWRSYRISSVGHIYGEKSWVGVYCARGRIIVGVGREGVSAVISHDFYERPVKQRSTEPDFDDSFHGGKWMGIGYFQSNSPQAGYVLAPIWMIWALATLPVLIAIIRIARRKLRSSGCLCVNCGFDLRGIGEKCPECGEPVVRKRGDLAYKD